MSDIVCVISPTAGMELPAFLVSPGLEITQGGETQDAVLLEVLDHCKFLHSAVQRLEQKIDELQSNRITTGADRNQKSPEESPFGTGQISWSLAQRLGPSPQTNHRWNPRWNRSSARHAPWASDPPPNPYRPRGGWRGKSRGCRGRYGAEDNRGPPPQQTLSEQLQPVPPPDEELGVKAAKVQKKGSHPDKGARKPWKRLVASVETQTEPRVLVSVKQEEDTPPAEEEEKVMIGGAKPKVWIPMSVYTRALKEAKPQRAVVPMLHCLFPINTLSCSAVTGDPLRGIQQLGPNKLEALREWLAEMYPHYDVSVRGSAWTQCLRVINNITKNLHRTQGMSRNTEAGGP